MPTPQEDRLEVERELTEQENVAVDALRERLFSLVEGFRIRGVSEFRVEMPQVAGAGAGDSRSLSFPCAFSGRLYPPGQVDASENSQGGDTITEVKPRRGLDILADDDDAPQPSILEQAQKPDVTP